MAYRFLIVGAGVAGASAAARLAPLGATLVLEAEDQPGYHATGRSAATYIDTYGAPTVCAATRASRSFFWSPPQGFADHALVRPIPELCLARPEQADALAAHLATHPDLRPLGAAEIRRMCPILRSEVDWSGALNDRVAELDVDAILQGYLKLARAAGADLVTGARVAALAPRPGGGWRVATAAGGFEADVVVNAAGAWAGEVGRLAGLGDLGLTPLRRTAIRIDPAMRAEQVRRVAHRWAGLRTFAPDRVPVVGMDPRADGFFWLAGQGGYGIQTSPALSETAAALINEGRLPQALRAEGVSEADLGPGRFL
ncbi:MAG: FAD-binding oxidoreductase [Caulobacterales bacterium]|nr:FAD-binding oxidoreductase [Caulobacterales bacterium]